MQSVQLRADPAWHTEVSSFLGLGTALPLPLTSCLLQDKSHNLSRPQFPHQCSSLICNWKINCHMNHKPHSVHGVNGDTKCWDTMSQMLERLSQKQETL
jgi:hypothetical protein